MTTMAFNVPRVPKVVEFFKDFFLFLHFPTYNLPTLKFVQMKRIREVPAYPVSSFGGEVKIFFFQITHFPTVIIHLFIFQKYTVIHMD